MSHNKDKKQSYRAVLSSVKEEMTEPRIAESVHGEAEKRRTARIKEGVKR
jgi:hypothetical protein